MDKTRYIIEIKYAHDKKGENVEMVEIHTEDLEWSMKQYQRNRQPLTWELLDIKEPATTLDIENDVCCGLPDICSSC